MKKKFSKLVSIVLAVALVFATLVPTFVFADSESSSSGGSSGGGSGSSSKITLMDFGDSAELGSLNFTGKGEPSAFAAEGKDSSLKYTANIVFDEETQTYVQNNEVLNMYYDELNLSRYADDTATINIKFYTEAEGSKFNFVFLGSENTTKCDITPDDGKDNPVSTYNQKLYTVDNGWQVYSIKLTDAIGKFYNYSDDNLLNIRIIANAWGNLNATTGEAGYKDDDTLYIDEIYVETNPDKYYDNLELAGNKVIWKSEDGTISGGTPTKKIDAEKGEYTSFTGTKGKSTTIRLAGEVSKNEDNIECYTSLFNTESYTWFNTWIYSPKAQDDGLNILLYTNKRNDSDPDGDGVKGAKDADDAAIVDGEKLSKNENAYPIFHHIQQVNWEGWKLVSIALPASAQNQKIIVIELNAGGWNGNGYTNLPNQNDLYFGIDGMWLSSGEASPQSEWEASRAYGDVAAVTPANGDIAIADFNTPDSVPQANRVSADNPFIYDMNARLSFNSATYQNLYDVAENNSDGKMPSAAKATMTIYGSSSNSTDFIDVNDGLTADSYVNFWLYNPEPKYTWDGTTYGDIAVIFGYWNGSKTMLCPLYILADWSGWKLVSVPVNSINKNLVSTGINYIYFAINGGWFAVTKKTSDDVTPAVNKVTRTDAQIAQGWAAGGSMNVIAKAYDTANSKNIDGNNFNYVDVARVWISNGAPDAELNITAQDNSALICPETESSLIALYTTDDAIESVSFKAIKADGANNITGVDASIENGSLVLADGFAYDSHYSVYAEIRNHAGVTVNKEFDFDVEAYHVYDMTTSADGKTATVKMHGVLPDDYANAVLVAAVYSTNGDAVKLESVNKADYDSAAGNLTATIDALADGQTVKFMFLSGLDTLKPIADNVRK